MFFESKDGLILDKILFDFDSDFLKKSGSFFDCFVYALLVSLLK